MPEIRNSQELKLNNLESDISDEKPTVMMPDNVKNFQDIILETLVS